jgi:pyruvate,water dikinase
MDDFGDMQPGEVVVIDAVQPQMTFIIPIAGGIVERRGGMLVHSSIIARELGIPAVNGVSRATELIQTGDVITVNGDMGLVVVGEADFELERSFDSSTPSTSLL